jgi:hypothetical protein
MPLITSNLRSAINRLTHSPLLYQIELQTLELCPIPSFVDCSWPSIAIRAYFRFSLYFQGNFKKLNINSMIGFFSHIGRPKYPRRELELKALYRNIYSIELNKAHIILIPAH